MLTEQEVIKKLHIQAEEFRQAVRHKNYMRAKALYNSARTVAVFMKLGGEEMSELFGQYGGLPDDEEAPQGLFPRDEVSRVDLECCIKRNKAYEDQACRKTGQPVSFYSDEDYCARCRKSRG